MESRQVTVINALSEKEFIRLGFHLLFKQRFAKVFFWIMVVFGLIVVGSSLVATACFSEMPIDNLFQSFIPLFVLLVYCGMLYWGFKKSYSGNSSMFRETAYEFTENHLKVSGNSFDTRMEWSNIIKVEVDKNWFLIWQTKKMAMGLRKDIFKLEDLEHIKGILTSNSVPNNL